MTEARRWRSALPSVLGVAAAVLLVGTAARPAAAQQLPEGVSEETVRQGRQIFVGNGFCYTCHGREGRGVPNLGADLTDRDWKHSDGSFRGLVDRIREGVPAEESASGVPMPPAGGANLTGEQVRAVAAYVWTLSRGG